MARPLRTGTPPSAVAALPRTLAPMRAGRFDPTMRLSEFGLARATITPDGPGTVLLDWSTGAVRATAHGPGADWLLARVPAMCGDTDEGFEFTGAHPVVTAAQRRHPGLRLGASGTLYHDLLPVIIAQRITAGEAMRQWRLLVLRLGEPAPGPDLGLRLPPTPERLAGTPGWWLHRLGIERARADTLAAVARHGEAITAWADLSPAEAGGRLRLLHGVGAWTVGSTLAVSFGDPDAIAVGDYHLKHVVVHAFTGRPRGTDEEMLELLAPYAGQRGRVVRLLHADGHRAPAFGPRQRVLAMSRW